MATYTIEKKNFKGDHQITNETLLLDILEIGQAEDLLKIQSQITNEITEPISELTLNGLTKKSNYAFAGLMYCLVIEEGSCIGYGYGYLDESDVFYIDTIGVAQEHRRKKVATDIKATLIKHAFGLKNVNTVKAITQENNTGAIAINDALGLQIEVGIQEPQDDIPSDNL